MSGNRENPFHQWIQLEQPRLGSRVVFATDDFFAPKERLIAATAPVFIPDKYDDHGKWMDGWESRRKRDAGHDYCVLRLGTPGVIHGLDIDTSHFTGNFPPAASVDACVCKSDMPADDGDWFELLPRVDLGGDAHHFIPVSNNRIVTHLRLNIFPDGGIARLRVYGEIRPDKARIDGNGEIDLLALEHGGRALACSDEHYGSMHNLNVAGRGINMGDGWETARRRGPGNDWVILALGLPGMIERVELDTAFFKGNYPDRAEIRAARVLGTGDWRAESERWPILLPQLKLAADTVHRFRDELQQVGAVSHVRLNIYPDGGVSRLRLFGRMDPDNTSSDEEST
jgi:allantoicase